ncbi:MAG TPA: adenylate/guanylate cyclase domain-containing protein [Candidatus Limnocylindrales bacterium]|nr:adenylate/guanylate cyclase domain-containing protein [Candidatus Limnocylindrales bacterium]
MPSRAEPMTEYFPGANPHPVMRVAADGTLIYANRASTPLLEALDLAVGKLVPSQWLEWIQTAAGPIDVRVGPRTFELLAVSLAELGFTNVYATDVTAERAITKFPDQNPNPVFRISTTGELVYVNAAAQDLIAGVGGVLGRPLPSPLCADLQAAAREGARRTVRVHSGDRDYALLAVDVPEFEFTNVYGTDVTAVLALEEANQKNVELLLNILPEPIADRLRSGESLIADRYEDVSLLFADIVGFTGMSSAMDAAELVTLLNDVFSVFDGLVAQSGLEKVKTIGDAYMIVGGMPIWQPDHLERLATLALDIATEVGRNDAARRLGVEFRIGMHTGPVVAGVIGTRKFIYDVWGDTVNVASRMESTGIPGRIQVTGAVERRLRDRFVLTSRGEIEVKGKGQMETFFLLGQAR